jgi:hypothetical protein
MSPAGIAMFYAAEDEKTAFLETYDPKEAHMCLMTFGRFLTARSLKLLDLTSIPDVPSIFDEARFETREEIIFLHQLAEDISKPIERDDRVHYEYVPTQIVAEYFRSVFKSAREYIDGVAFKSSRKGAGISYCIFTDSNGCFDSFRDKKAPKFSFDKKRRVLVLENVSCKLISNCTAMYGHV